MRNIGFHLWFATLITIPLSFYILPWLIRLFPGINPIATGFFILIWVVSGTGFFMDYAARRKISAYIKEGQIWERSGISNKAEKNYTNAVRLYDSFLLWPFSTKKIAQKISRAIAKFKLNTAIENQSFKLITAVYLKRNPTDEDIAQLWLSQLRNSIHVTSLEQDVLSVLFDTHYASKRLSGLMADIFRELEQKDFIAKNLYPPVLTPPLLEDRHLERIGEVIGRPGETFQKQIFFHQEERIFQDNRGIKTTFKSLAETTIDRLKSFRAIMGSGARFCIVSLIKGVSVIKEHEKLQFYLKAGTLLIVLAGLGFFMINTLSHMFKPGTTEAEKISIQMKVPLPFTIQVAAYLDQEYAHKYIEGLRKKGINAMVKSVDGGGKTWYVIRVSEFPDKKSAAVYGQTLKQQKIIDDFFVSNKQ